MFSVKTHMEYMHCGVRMRLGISLTKNILRSNNVSNEYPLTHQRNFRFLVLKYNGNTL